MNDSQNWQAIYRELAGVIGPTATQKLQAYLGGMQVSFPRRLLAPAKEAALIYQGHQAGCTLVQLARQHDYSERNIRRILARYRGKG
ncbi:Mor transcription activator family protein [Levilactobacillus zymae]|uniref:Mor transcription activator family protein n=1 Tax=Levilactobacillus zymae TaxID=267363 RepID=UPI0028B8C459|nr:Mor transcription activator family protein [Levilactobacillus zymae]MDT6979627.1 Mor transcription activator family protein [Levilactobacillus zymae]